MRSGKTLAIAALLVALPAASVLAVLSRQAPSAQARSKTPSFITYQLGATTGESCPNTTTPCLDLSPCLKAGDSWAEHSGPGMLARRQNAVTG
jgi:hypothetical protein